MVGLTVRKLVQHAVWKRGEADQDGHERAEQHVGVLQPTRQQMCADGYKKKHCDLYRTII